MDNLIRQMLLEITEYENNNLQNNIKKRLDESLKAYLSNLNNSYNYVIDNIEDKYTIKELTK